MNALMKDIFRDMKNSKGRFISIASIIALGVLLFIGVKAAPIDMKYNADKFYDDTNFMDIRVISTLGLSDDDLADIENIDGVLCAQPEKFMDAITIKDSDELVIRVHGLSDKADGKGGAINDVSLQEGRLPEAPNECVIGLEKFKKLDLKIGDVISLQSGNDEGLSEKLNYTEYKIVGVVTTPFYLNSTLGSSSIGNGTVSQYIYINEENFKTDVYSDIVVIVSGAKELDSYKDEYFDVVDKVKDKIEGISDVIIDRRYKSVKDDAEKTLSEKKKEYEDKRAEVLSQLSEAENEIKKGGEQLDSAKIELAQKEDEYYKGIDEGERQIKEAEDKLNSGEAEYSKKLQEFNSAKSSAQVSIGISESALNYAMSNLETFENEKDELQSKIDSGTITGAEKVLAKEKIKILEASIIAAEDKIKGYEADLNDKKMQLEEGERQLLEGRNKLDAGWNELNLKKSQYESAKDEGKEQLDNAQKLINENEEKLQQGKHEYEKNKAEAEDGLNKAEKKLHDAEDEIAKLEEAELYVLDRKMHYPYVDYENSAESMNKLSNVFPVFFFIVAALVCSTTMTRMVSEERINIGTLKALGYSKGLIAKKFILYALFASIIGVLAGLIGGFTILPMVIYNAYNIMYSLPKMIIRFSLPLALLVSIAAISVTTISTFSACRYDLRETPAALMIPKAPKSGKRILLEYIPFIWNRFSFIGKVTVRNLFRYKKRFFMTVIGISGSTALLLAGLGIRDSISTIVNDQYKGVYKYELSFTMDNNIGTEEKNAITEYLNFESRINEYIFVNKTSAQVIKGDDIKDVTLIAAEDADDFVKFIALRKRGTEEKIPLDDSGVVITEKLADKLNVKVGDEIQLKNSNGITKAVKVSGITENYIQHYVYMTSSYYNDVFGRIPDENASYVMITEDGNEETVVKDISSSITELKGISGVSNSASLEKTFDDTIKSLNFVIFVMILCAGALSFIVLYNLTNLNISERIREIATIKVLGFYDGEVAMYIMRENIFLTIIGMIFGLLLGIVFHRFIITTVEMDYVMFGRNIHKISFLYGALLTMVFSGLVNFAMHFKLMKVKMVESLKSVD